MAPTETTMDVDMKDVNSPTTETETEVPKKDVDTATTEGIIWTEINYLKFAFEFKKKNLRTTAPGAGKYIFDYFK